MGNFKEDIARTEAMVFDVDGVFTDGGITPTADGDFLREYNTKDGFVIRYAIKQGLPIFIITGGKGNNIERRFTDLGVTRIYKNADDKITNLKQIIADYGYNRENIIFMGDDAPDVECMKYVGIPVCPADAVSDVMDVARYVSEFNGGRGCVRDIVEQVLRAQGKWVKYSDGVDGIRSE